MLFIPPKRPLLAKVPFKLLQQNLISAVLSQSEINIHSFVG